MNKPHKQSLKSKNWKAWEKSENQLLAKYHEVISTAIEEENLLTESLREVDNPQKSFGDKVSDGISAFGGSWFFILTFLGFMALWMSWNSWLGGFFDPYPFIFLNLILSCISALQAPIIMMSQNRKEQRDRKRAESDYLINLKSEVEIRNLHKKLDLLMVEQLKNLLDIQKEQIILLKNLQHMNKDRHS